VSLLFGDAFFDDGSSSDSSLISEIKELFMLNDVDPFLKNVASDLDCYKY
jgi:hypothetical protein